jgi:hypothetical protein
MTIRVPYAGNPSFRAGSSLLEAIMAEAHITHFFQIRTDGVTLSGTDILTITDRKAGGALFTNNGATKRAVLTDNKFAARPGAVLTRAKAGYTYSGAAIDMTQPFSIIGDAIVDDAEVDNNILGRYTAAATNMLVNNQAKTAEVKMWYAGTKSAAVPITTGTPFGYMAAFDGAKARFAANGVLTPEFTPSAITPGTGNFLWGGLSSGGSQTLLGTIRHMFITDMSVFAPTPDAIRIKSLLDDYLRQVSAVATLPAA